MLAVRPGPAFAALPVPVVAAVLSVEAAAVTVTLAGVAPVTPTQLALAGFIALLSVVHTELATGIERVRRRTADTSYFDLSSVWTFTAALLLPPMLATAVVLVVYAHLWHRVWKPADVPAHRHVFTTATVVLAAGAAHAVVQTAGGLPSKPDDLAGVVGVAVAVLAYVTVNTVLVAGAISLSAGPAESGGSEKLGLRERLGLRDLFGRWDDNALEVATLCMGALAALALQVAPGLVVLVLPPIVVLHRAVRVRGLEEVASIDAKTGLLNLAAWRSQAARSLGRARHTGSGAAVLILDLDHFKTVNDVHGHLAGDDVLAAVAAELRAGVRAHDLVGRFGGEEFVVLLPDLPAGPRGRVELAVVAERLRERISRLDVAVATADGVRTITGLSISIGGAAVPVDGTDLDQVLRAADASLYAAKRDGRNLVRIAGHSEIPAPRKSIV